MTNEMRSKEIVEKYGKYVDELVKTDKQGWHIVIKDKKLIDKNKGSNIVKGSNPPGLAEAYARLKQLVRQIEVKVEVKAEVKAAVVQK